ncbi:MAG: hypothetical protein ACXVPU_01680 [Bacteroidia bacterium]
MEDINSETNMPPKMPQFLKVLCILTFIGAGLGFLGGIYNLIKAPTAVEDFEQRQEMMGDAAKGGFLGNMMESAHQSAINAFPLAAGTIGSNLFCLIGAWMMWKQRKAGYYAYVVGQLFGIAVPAVFMGFSIFLIIGIAFPIAFIIMYGLNLKHMS